MYKLQNLLLILTLFSASNVYADPGHHKHHKAVQITISGLSSQLSLRVNKYIGETEKNLSKIKSGKSFKATVLQPKKLARLGLKGLRKGDRVKVVGLANGRVGIVPLRPKMKPAILKKIDGVITSCGCFEHQKDLQLLRNLRMRPGQKKLLHKR